jgi:hypothetical protein
MSLPALMALPLLTLPCADLADFSRTVMQANQVGIPIESMLSQTLRSEVLTYVTISAYQYPRTGEWFYSSQSFGKAVEGLCHAANR